MITLLGDSEDTFELGLKLHSGEYGYIMAINCKRELILLDRMRASLAGYYRSYGLQLEGKTDQFAIVGIVSKLPINLLVRAPFREPLANIVDWSLDGVIEWIQVTDPQQEQTFVLTGCEVLHRDKRFSAYSEFNSKGLIQIN